MSGRNGSDPWSMFSNLAPSSSDQWVSIKISPIKSGLVIYSMNVLTSFGLSASKWARMRPPGTSCVLPDQSSPEQQRSDIDPWHIPML